VTGTYIDDETGDYYDVFGSTGNLLQLVRVRDGWQVVMDRATHMAVNESEEARLRRLNRHPQQTMHSFARQASALPNPTEDNIYNLYSTYQAAEPLGRGEQRRYERSLAQTDEDSRRHVASHPQGEDGQRNRDSTRRTLMDNPRRLTPTEMGMDFYRAESTGTVREDATLARIALRLAPAYATAVWDYISRHMVGRHGIKSAKVAGHWQSTRAATA